MALILSFNVYAAQLAEVSIDGAMVYKNSNFDAPVIAYLKKAKRVKISSRKYGAFYRVLLKPGLIGYISDIDVKVVSRSTRNTRRRRPRQRSRSRRDRDRYQDERFDDRRNRREKEDRFADEEESYEDQWGDSKEDRRKNRRRGESIFARRYIGGGAGIVNYKEEVLNQSLASNTNSIFAKATGPELLFKGPYIFDVNLLVSLGPPAYYGEISETGASGFFAFLDALFLYPYHNPTYEKWAIYFGGGPLLAYSKFSGVTPVGEEDPLDLQDLKLGISVMAGFSYEVGRDYVLKLEPKYYIEKNSFFGIFGSVQKEF